MLLSIITINLNNSNGLLTTIESVLTQEFSDFEYIIIDGGSTDESLSIIEKYKSKIDIFISEPDSGIYNAMNKGLKFAQGEYILFLNSGDCFESNQTLVNIFNKYDNSDFIFGAITSSFLKRKESIFPPEKLTFSFLFRFGINHQATFTKRTLFLNYGFYDENLKFAADWKFLILALCKYNASYQVIPVIVSIYNPYGISSINESVIQNEKREFILESFPLFEADYKRYFKLNRYTFKGILFIVRRLINKLK